MHPLHLFNYCPCCGAPAFAANDERSKRCAQCGFVFYHNASAATVAVILNAQGQLLVARRAKDPARGTLDLPGGFVDPGESIDEGCRREVLEETGAEVVRLTYLFSLPNVYRFSGFDVHTADAFFLCEIADESLLKGADDVADLQWMNLADVRPEDFGLTSIRRGVARMLAEGLLFQNQQTAP
jgi:NADH pyrophosphatase NudC (nudix superfamily)